MYINYLSSKITRVDAEKRSAKICAHVGLVRSRGVQKFDAKAFINYCTIVFRKSFKCYFVPDA